MLATFLHTFRLTQEGVQLYYAAAVRSMDQSLHNFLYAAADPAGFLAVDKPEFPYVRVNVRGRAEVVSEEWSERWVEMTRAMTVRYVGEQGLQYLEARLKYPLSVIRLSPLELNSWKVTDFPPDRTFTAEAKWHQAVGG